MNARLRSPFPDREARRLEYAVQLLILVMGGMYLSWLAVDRLGWPDWVVPLGAVLGMGAGLAIVYKNLVLVPKLREDEAAKAKAAQADKADPKRDGRHPPDAPPST